MTFLHSLRRILLPPPAVFLCSTFEDLYLERLAISSELRKFRVVKMEDFWKNWMKEGNPYNPEDTFGSWNALSWVRSGIRKSDIVIVLLAGESGSTVPGTGKTFLEFEIELATRLRRKLLVYKLHRPFPDGEWLQRNFWHNQAEALEASRQGRSSPVVPDRIPVNDVLVFLMAPQMAARSRQLREMRFPYYSRWRDSAVLELETNAILPTATDLYSAREMLERIRLDVSSLTPRFPLGLLAPYFVIVCTVVFIVYRLWFY